MTPKPTLDGPTTRYEAYQHAELAQVVERNFNADTAHQIADDWKNIGEALTELAVDFSIIITGSKEGWTGSAAEGARNALLKVGEFSDTAGDQFTRTSDVVREQTYAASEAKAKMPPPVEFDPHKMFSDAVRSGSFIDVMALPFTIPAQQRKAAEAKAEAVDVLYARDNALHSAMVGMPALEEPPKVTQEQGVTTASSQHSSVSTHTVDPTGRVGTGTPMAATTTSSAVPTAVDGSGTTRTSWTAPPTTTPPPLTPPVPGYHQPPVTPTVTPPGVMPPGRRPSAGPVVPPRGTTRVPPGGGSPTGSGGGRNALGRPGMPGVPGPGLSGPGPSGPGATGGGAAGAGAAGAGAGGQRAAGFGPTGGASFGPAGSQGRAVHGAGAAGFGAAGVGGAPAGGQGGEDQEHQTKYLIPTDEYFDDTRMVAPETIGE